MTEESSTPAELPSWIKTQYFWQFDHQLGSHRELPIDYDAVRLVARHGSIQGVSVLLNNQVDSSLEVDANGTVVHVEPAALELFNVSDASLMIGRGIDEFFRRNDSQQLLASIERSGGVLLSALRSRENREVEVCVSVSRRTDSGISALLVRPLERVCPLRRTIAALEDEQDQLFRQLQVGVVVQGPALEVLRWNDKALELLGMTEEQLAGRTSFDPRWNVIHLDGSDFPGQTHPAVVAAHSKAPVNGVVMGVFRPTTDDRVWLMVDAKPRLDVAGNLLDVVVTFTDITAQQRLAEEFAKAQTFEIASRMAGSISHDFNNMLAVITAVAERRMFDAASEEEQADLQHILDAAQRGSQLTRRLVDLSGAGLEQAHPLWLDAHLAEMSDLLQRAVGEGIACQLQLGAPQARLTVDSSRLEQAVLNLAINARDAMQGSGTLTVQTSICRSGEATFVKIDVIDSGPGIADDVAAHVFEPFFTTKQDGQGTGLGLASVHQFATTMDGKVSFETSPAGTTFHLELPCKLRNPEDFLVVASEPDQSTSEKRTRRLLVVDNDPDVRTSLANLLNRAGYDVMIAASGEAALQVLSANEVDLLVTDLIMQSMDGASLAKLARQTQPSLPVLFMSGFAGSHGADLPPMSEMSQFLAKPLTKADLLSAISSLLPEGSAL